MWDCSEMNQSQSRKMGQKLSDPQWKYVNSPCSSGLCSGISKLQQVQVLLLILGCERMVHECVCAVAFPPGTHSKHQNRLMSEPHVSEHLDMEPSFVCHLWNCCMEHTLESARSNTKCRKTYLKNTLGKRCPHWPLAHTLPPEGHVTIQSGVTPLIFFHCIHNRFLQQKSKMLINGKK